MKRHLHFYQWLLCLLLAMGSHLFAYSQGKAIFLEDLQAGDVIKIYPAGHYGVDNWALACKGDGMKLRSEGGKGSEWTLIDAGDGYYYLKNELGCYWAYQDNSLKHSLTCTTNINSAVKVKLAWDYFFIGVRFINQKDGYGLESSSNNWCQTPSYSSSESSFQVYSPSGGGTEVTIDEIKYLLNAKRKKARVLENNYAGNVVIPQMVSYNGDRFRVTSLDNKCFSGCSNLSSITLSKGITFMGDYCFKGCSSLNNITLPEGITSLGYECFRGCSSLTSITLPKGIKYLYSHCFYDCRNLINITLPEGITSLGFGCFENCYSLTDITLPEGITSLEKGCFKNCYRLTSVSFPATLKEKNYYKCTHTA